MGEVRGGQDLDLGLGSRGGRVVVDWRGRIGGRGTMIGGSRSLVVMRSSRSLARSGSTKGRSKIERLLMPALL